MTSFDKQDKGALDASHLTKGTLPRVEPRPVQSEHSAYDLVTTVLPAIQRLPLPELEKPERKTTLLLGLSSQVLEEFQAALDSLKGDLRLGSEKFFWPVVLEVLNTPGNRRHFASRIGANATHMETLPEVFLASLLETLASSPNLGLRKLRCQGRILAEMVWLAPHSCSRQIAQAIKSNPRVLRPFAVSLVSAGGPYEMRSHWSRKFHFETPPTFVCHYLIHEITSVLAEGNSNLEVLLSGGALQLASTCSTSLVAINAVLCGRARPPSAPVSFTLLEAVCLYWSKAKQRSDYRNMRLSHAAFQEALSERLEEPTGFAKRIFNWEHCVKLPDAHSSESPIPAPLAELVLKFSAQFRNRSWIRSGLFRPSWHNFLKNMVSGKPLDELFPSSAPRLSLRIFSESLYQWAETKQVDEAVQRDRLAKASILTEEILKTVANEEPRTSDTLFLEDLVRWAKADHADAALHPDLMVRNTPWMKARLKSHPVHEKRPLRTDRDLFFGLLRFSASRSVSSATETVKLLATGTKNPQLSPSQEVAFTFLGRELASAPNSPLSKLFASQATLQAFIDAPEEMQRLAEIAKAVIEEESQKRSAKAKTWLGAARLNLISSAQRYPPGIDWWMVLALLNTESKAAQFAPFWKAQVLYEDKSQDPRGFLAVLSALLPYVKDAADLRNSYAFWGDSETTTRLQSLADWSYSERKKLKDTTSWSAETTRPLINWSAPREDAAELKQIELLLFFLPRDLRDKPASEKLEELMTALGEGTVDEFLAFIRLTAKSVQTVPWQGPQKEFETYRSFIRTFGPVHLPTLYSAFRTLQTGSEWREFRHLDHLLTHRLCLLHKVCHDEVHSVSSDSLELELLEQICQLGLNSFGDTQRAIAQVRNWSALSEIRRSAYAAARAPSAPAGGDRKVWQQQHVAALRAESAWEAFTTVGQQSTNLTVRQFVPQFDPPRRSTPGFSFLDPVFLDSIMRRDYEDFARLIPSWDFLPNIKTLSASHKAEPLAWQRSVLRALIENGASDSVTKHNIEEYQDWVSVMTLRIVCSAPAPGQKSYLRYNRSLDNRGRALMWADIGAGLFEGTLAEEYIFRDVTWSPERRQEFLKRLRAALPYDDMVDALERHAATVQSHPATTDLGESCTLTMIPTRGIARELSGHLYDVCWATNEHAFRSAKGVDDGRQNIISVTFVRDYNTPKATIVGGSLVIIGYATENPRQPVIIIRGCNPRGSFLRDVYVGEVFDQWIGYLSLVAHAGKMEIAIPADPVPFMALTNQPDLFYYARKHFFTGVPLDVGSVTLTEFNGIRVGDRLRRIELRPVRK